MTFFCPNCGTELNGAKFCPNCGRAAEEPENLHGATAEVFEGAAAAPASKVAEPSVQVKGSMNGRRIAGIVCLGLAFFGAIAAATSGDPAESLPLAIVFAVVGLPMLLIKGKTKQQKEEIKKYYLNHANLSHQAGLPLAQGVACEVGREEGGSFTFIGGGNVFTLSHDKITDICIKTDAEIQTEYISSSTDFFKTGTMVSGRVSYYLIFTYLKDGGISYISFEMWMVLKNVRKWIKEFKQQYDQTQGKMVKL